MCGIIRGYNLVPTTTNDDQDITTPNKDAISVASEYYNRNGYSKALLFAMAIGMKEATGDADLLQLDKEPWSKMPKKDAKPKKDVILNEIRRRCADGKL